MEIGPVPGVRTFVTPKSLPEDFQLSIATDVEAMAHIGDGVRASGRRKGAVNEDAEADDSAIATDLETADGSTEDAAGTTPAGHVSVFA